MGVVSQFEAIEHCFMEIIVVSGPTFEDQRDLKIFLSQFILWHFNLL